MVKSFFAAVAVTAIFATSGAYAQSALVETTPQVRGALAAEMAAPMAQSTPTTARELQIALHPEYVVYAALLSENHWAPAPAPHAMNVAITPRLECEAYAVMARLAAQ